MIGVRLVIALAAVAFGVRGKLRRMESEYNDLAADYDEIMQIWLATHRENLDLRERLKIGDDEGEV